MSELILEDGTGGLSYQCNNEAFICYKFSYKLTSFSYDFAGLQQINLSPLPFGMLCAFKHFGRGISVNNLPSWHQVYIMWIVEVYQNK